MDIKQAERFENKPAYYRGPTKRLELALADYWLEAFHFFSDSLSNLDWFRFETFNLKASALIRQQR